ncbi:hypothetical protein V494_06310 [Pseudogymnoascus sp. VKM F-4513 (FW-928)]|nr:hypothetical protein V494_06310 [Pseudogymnoascus sp. VKM F-4513 (FW-928)]
MAICKDLKGVSVSITINGNKVTEYEAPMDETQHHHPKKTVLRYIEAISGANYSILNEISPSYKMKSSLAFQVQVDGWTLPADPLFIRSKYSGAWIRTIDGKEQVDYKGRRWKKPFKFSSLNIVDAHDKERIKRDTNVSKNIGEIKVTVLRRQVKEEIQERSTGGYGNTSLEIAEKAVKGQTLSHGTELGEAVLCTEKKSTFNATNQRGSRDPAAVFIFRYRSREALEAEHIIPRSQSSDILRRFTAEELQAMRELLAEEELSNSIKIKKEAGVNDGGPRKFTNDDETLTIDLTGDEEVEIWEPKAPKERVDLCD